MITGLFRDRHFEIPEADRSGLDIIATMIQAIYDTSLDRACRREVSVDQASSHSMATLKLYAALRCSHEIPASRDFRRGIQPLTNATSSSRDKQAQRQESVLDAAPRVPRRS